MLSEGMMMLQQSSIRAMCELVPQTDEAYKRDQTHAVSLRVPADRKISPSANGCGASQKKIRQPSLVTQNRIEAGLLVVFQQRVYRYPT